MGSHHTISVVINFVQWQSLFLISYRCEIVPPTKCNLKTPIQGLKCSDFTSFTCHGDRRDAVAASELDGFTVPEVGVK
jgi:hypothetical protein